MYTIAIDLGGTVVKIGLLSDGEIVDCVRLPSRLALGLAPNLPKIKEAIDRLLAAWRIDVAALRCIGLAFPGLVDPIHNRVISTNEKYDDACSISLDKWAWENWEVPFCMDNDARLAVAGEWWQGAARGKNNVVMMTIGTGIGTGVVIDGRLLYGQHFQAGSLGGHFVLDYKGRRCSCGNKGCVEALSSSFFLPTIIREHALLTEVLPRLEAQEDYSNDALYAMLCEYVAEKGVKNGYVMWPIRTAVSGKQMTPGGATELMEILGKEESIARIKKGIELLSK